MTNPSDGATPPFMVTVDEHQVCIIVPSGQLLSTHSAAIVRAVQSLVCTRPLAGLLLDTDDAPLLSMVRLSSLLDMLCGLELPLAVLFNSKPQRQLAELMHNTLTHKERVAYFTERSDAYAFLLGHAPDR